MRDALKNYLALANGLTEVTKQQAKIAAKALVKQGEATKGQVEQLADDLLQTSRQNRELITAIVRSELEKNLSRLGLATADEVGKLGRRLQSLEEALRAAAGDEAVAAATAAAGGTAAPAKTAKTTKSAAADGATRPAKAPAGGAAAARKPAAKKSAGKATK